MRNTINFRLLGVLMLMRFLPVIYTTVRVNFLGELPSAWGFNIASQVAWLNLIYEVVAEAFLLPLYYALAAAIDDRAEFAARLRTAFLIFVGVYLLLSLLVLLFADVLVASLSQHQAQVAQTIRYIRLETVAMMVSAAHLFMLVVFTLKKQTGKLLVLLCAQTGLTVLLDALLVSNLPMSFQLGINGVAFTNIAVNALLVLLSFWLLAKMGIDWRVARNPRANAAWLIDWFAVAARAGLESLVRNLAFIVMILKMMNVLAQQGVFWVTNHFIWGWLLLPILALGELIKRNSALHGMSGDALRHYALLTAGVVLLWMVTIPFWCAFIQNVMGVDDAATVVSLSLLLLGFYVLFAFNNIVDSFFYGIGRTDLMLYQSLLVSVFFYGTAFLLFMTGVYQPTLNKVALMFGLGITLDSLITFYLLWRLYCPLDAAAQLSAASVVGKTHGRHSRRH